MNEQITTTQTNLRQSKPKFSNLVTSFILNHLRCFFSTLGSLTKTPIATLLTSASMGIALALPAGLYEMLLTVQQAGGELNQINKITLYLKQETNDQQVHNLIKQLSSLPEIIQIEHKTKQQALKEFRENSGFGEALTALTENPLPHVIIIEPKSLYTSPTNIDLLLNKLKQYPSVETAQLDIQWIKRLFSIINVGKTSIIVISSLLGIAVLLIVGNTIRLGIENKRKEILIVKLIGGTNSFIRRPFLYTGIWYGIFGGILAIIFIDISIIIINQPLTELNSLYQSALLHLHITPLTHKIQLLAISMFLGFAGALIAVNKQLKRIELR